MGNLTHIFQMDWNHPPVKVLSAFITSRNREENHQYRFHFYGRLELFKSVSVLDLVFFPKVGMEQPKKKETRTGRSLKIFTLVFFVFFGFSSFEHLTHLQGTRFPRLGGEGYTWVGRVGVWSQGGLVDWLPHEHETRGFKVHLVENSNKTDVGKNGKRYVKYLGLQR